MHRTANGNEKKLSFSLYRALKLLKFANFTQKNNTFLTRDELKHAIRSKMAFHATAIEKITKRSCTAVIRRFRHLRNIATETYLEQQAQSQTDPYQHWLNWYKDNGMAFTRVRNSTIRDSVRRKGGEPIISLSISTGTNRFMTKWRAAAKILGWLALTRKDLLLRLQLNGLPLGHKMRHGKDEYQLQ